MKSLSTKIITLIAVVLFVVSAALGFISYQYSSNAVVNEVNKSLSQLAQIGTEIVTSEINAQYNALEALAQDDTIKNPEISWEKKMDFLRAETDRAGYVNMGIADLKGDLVTCNGSHYNLGEYSFFHDVLKGNPAVSDPIIDEKDETLIMMFAVPVYYNEQISGVLVAVRDGYFLCDVMKRLVFGESGTAFMINSKGDAIANNDPEMVLNSDNILEKAKEDPELAQFAEVQKKMVDGEAGVGSYVYKGNEKYCGYAPVPGTQWSLAVTALASEILAGAYQLRTIIIATSVIVLIVGALAAGLLSRRMVRPLKDAVAKIQEVAQGNLAIERLEVTSKDEIGVLREAINKMSASLRTLVNNISATATQVASSSEELSASSEQQAKAANEVSATISDMAQGAERQSAAVDGITNTVEETNAAIEQIAANTHTLVEGFNKATLAADQGQNAAKRAIVQMQNISAESSKVQEAIDKLAQSSNEIDKITNIIANIAEQTNLLALNAAIEAARAGEHGRGFAVVAEEVRKLAEQSQTAAKQIADLITLNRVNINEAVASMESNGREIQTGIEVVESAGQTFAQIYELTNQSAVQMQEISVAVQQLVENSQQIVDRVKDVDDIIKEMAASAQNASATTEEQAASTEEIAASSQSLAAMAQRLQDSIREFKL